MDLNFFQNNTIGMIMMTITQLNRTSISTTKPTASPIEKDRSLDTVVINSSESVVVPSVTTPHSGSLKNSTGNGHVPSTWSSTALIDINGLVDIHSEICSVIFGDVSSNFVR